MRAATASQRRVGRAALYKGHTGNARAECHDSNTELAHYPRFPRVDVCPVPAADCSPDTPPLIENASHESIVIAWLRCLKKPSRRNDLEKAAAASILRTSK